MVSFSEVLRSRYSFTQRINDKHNEVNLLLCFFFFYLFHTIFKISVSAYTFHIRLKPWVKQALKSSLENARDNGDFIWAERWILSLQLKGCIKRRSCRACQYIVFSENDLLLYNMLFTFLFAFHTVLFKIIQPPLRFPYDFCSK